MSPNESTQASSSSSTELDTVAKALQQVQVLMQAQGEEVNFDKENMI